MPEVEELDEQSLFDAAVSDEPEPPVADVAEAPEKPEAEVARDEVGRFAKAEEPEKPVIEAEKPADDNEGRVPSFRLKQEAEARRQLENDLAQERADKALLRQRLEALERPAPKSEPEKAAKPDPLLDPEGYAKAVREEIREELLNERRETSMEAAHEKYKEEFEQAMLAANQKLDLALKAKMQASRNPGETLIQWHREQKTRAEVGNDLAAYKARLREEALKDPEFLAKAIAAARESASTQDKDGRPRIDIAPSLNGISRTGAALRAADGDIADSELFNVTTA